MVTPIFKEVLNDQVELMIVGHQNLDSHTWIVVLNIVQPRII